MNFLVKIVFPQKVLRPFLDQCPCNLIVPGPWLPARLHQPAIALALVYFTLLVDATIGGPLPHDYWLNLLKCLHSLPHALGAMGAIGHLSFCLRWQFSLLLVATHMVHSYNIVFSFLFCKNYSQANGELWQFLNFLTGISSSLPRKYGFEMVRWLDGMGILYRCYMGICLAAPLIACQGHKLKPNSLPLDPKKTVRSSSLMRTILAVWALKTPFGR